MNNNEDARKRFVEVQYFWQQPLAWLVWVVAAVVLFSLRQAELIDPGFAIVAMIFVLALILLVIFTSLTTEIGTEGIGYRMWPFHRKIRVIPWSDIEQVEVIKYKPFREYGGWGVRTGLYGKAYTIKGKNGLQIKLNTGKNILLGTQKPDELQDVLDAIRR